MSWSAVALIAMLAVATAGCTGGSGDATPGASDVIPGGSEVQQTGQSSSAQPPGSPAADEGPKAPIPPSEVPVAENQPRLWIDELDPAGDGVYDLGQIPADGATEQVFTLTNVGNAPLEILSVTATCGCSTATVDADRLEPGESTELQVTYDPRANNELGMTVEKQVLIRTSDPLVPLAVISITADVAAQ